MACTSRFGFFTILALVLLRLATGWHFFKEGSKKLHDPSWSSAPFLQQAKGPLADFYHSKVPSFHNWEKLLALPRPADWLDESRQQELAEWEAAYAEEKTQAEEKGLPEPFRFSEYVPYGQWGNRVITDWQATLERFLRLPYLDQESKDDSLDAFLFRRTQLSLYLEAIDPDLREFQHDVSRLESMELDPASQSLTFQEERVATKKGELTSIALEWVQDVQDIEKAYFADLREIASKANEKAASEAESATAEKSSSSETTNSADDNAPENVETSQIDANSESSTATSEGTGNQGEAVQSDEEGETSPSNDDDETAESVGLPPEPGSDSDETAAENPEDDTSESDDSANSEEPSPPQAEDKNSESADQVSDSDSAFAPQDVAAEDSGDDAPQEKDATDQPEVFGEKNAPGGESMTIDAVFIDQTSKELADTDKYVTWLTLGVGVLLVLGLMTPMAALAGAGFLLAVISTQPPWVAGATPTYYQFVEMFGLLVLAATCAGRWAGLDFFIAALFRCCRSSD